MRRLDLKIENSRLAGFLEIVLTFLVRWLKGLLLPEEWSAWPRRPGFVQSSHLKMSQVRWGETRYQVNVNPGEETAGKAGRAWEQVSWGITGLPAILKSDLTGFSWTTQEKHKGTILQKYVKHEPRLRTLPGVVAVPAKIRVTMGSLQSSWCHHWKNGSWAQSAAKQPERVGRLTTATEGPVTC